MVIISASVCNKNGKILIARQFIQITRLKLEEYMANFPKLIESGNNSKYSLHLILRSVEPYFDLSFFELGMFTIREANNAYRNREHSVCLSSHGKAIPSPYH